MADTASLLPITACFLLRFIDFESDSDPKDSDSDCDGYFPFPQKQEFRNNTMPKDQGYTNYSSTEVKSFLEVLEEKLLVGSDQWQEVVDIH